MSGAMIAESTWRDLEQDAGSLSKTIETRELDVEAPAGTVMAAVDVDRQWHLLIPVEDGTPEREDKRSAGVHLYFRMLKDRGHSRRFLDMVCRRPELGTVFAALTREVCTAIEGNPAGAEDITFRTLARWRTFLERGRQALLSQERIKGLFGELVTLERLLGRVSDPVGIWEGPNGSKHDFVGMAATLEVKTSARQGALVFQVNGIDQLQAHDQRALYFVGVRVSSGLPGGISLPDLVGRLDPHVPDALVFHEKLSSAGYDVGQAASYADTTLTVQEIRLYRVEDPFPRLTPMNLVNGVLPPGVVGITYDIDLSGAMPSPLSDQAWDDLGRLLEARPR